MKIILSGGGTMGSVSPLLAIKETMDAQEIAVEYLWVGTREGIERTVVENENILYASISSGKLRRYFSWKNFIDPFRIIGGVFQSIKIILAFKPDIILSAGGFVSVPLVWAGWLLGVKSVIHQQDLRVGFANKLMVGCSTAVTVAFEKTVAMFPAKKVIHIGNPIRLDMLNGKREKAIAKYGLDPILPTLYVVGGSQGSEYFNQLMMDSIVDLIEFCQIVHVTGPHSKIDWVDREKFGEKAKRYHQTQYIYEGLGDLYAMADLVVCRAGLATLTELSVLGKPAVIIPIPDHQAEENANYFEVKNAVIRLDQNKTNVDHFVSLIEGLITNKNSLNRLKGNILGMMPEGVNERYVAFILDLIVGRR
jgi:UDP-N-acetylglucosamine--N-acetylmuramyl-(pentapeptide) pyrophosphoryl-undecaprenol N-acetylglucosamine transferase